MRCPHCQHEVSDKALICGRCGNGLVSQLELEERRAREEPIRQPSQSRPSDKAAQRSKRRSTQRPVVIRDYRGSDRSIRKEFTRDAMGMLDRGYEIEAQQVIPGRYGCARVAFGILLLGIPFLIARPKDTMIVTYRLRGS